MRRRKRNETSHRRRAMDPAPGGNLRDDFIFDAAGPGIGNSGVTLVRVWMLRRLLWIPESHAWRAREPQDHLHDRKFPVLAGRLRVAGRVTVGTFSDEFSRADRSSHGGPLSFCGICGAAFGASSRKY